MASPVHVSIEAAKPPTDNVVSVSSNPAYGEVTVSMGSIKVKKNTVHATVQPAVPPQYENVVMKENRGYAGALTATAVSPKSGDFLIQENKAHAIKQLAATVHTQSKDFVMTENSAYSIVQPTVSPQRTDIIVMTENSVYATTNTTTTAVSPRYENIMRVNMKRERHNSKHNYNNVDM